MQPQRLEIGQAIAQAEALQRAGQSSPKRDCARRASFQCDFRKSRIRSRAN
jgi:hypothetical protein